MNRILLYIVSLTLLLAYGCRTREKRVAEVKALAQLEGKQVGDWLIDLKYLPVKGDTAEYSFTVTVRPKEKMKPVEADDPKFSFGTDSLFCMIAGNSSDTLMPLHTMRVANGKLTGIEYLVVFDKAAVSSAGGGLRLLFKDWLFTNRNLMFTVPVAELQKIDSLSRKI